MTWSHSKTLTLRALWASGNTSSMIARELGVSRNAVIGKLNRLGLIGDMSKVSWRLRIRRGNQFAQHGRI